MIPEGAVHAFQKGGNQQSYPNIMPMNHINKHGMGCAYLEDNQQLSNT